MLTDASVISKGVWCSQTGAVDSIFATRCITYYVYSVYIKSEISYPVDSV